MNCENCAVLCDTLKSSPVGRFCVSCFLNWRCCWLELLVSFLWNIFNDLFRRRTGILRPTQGPQYISKNSRRLPSKANGMYFNRADVLKLAALDLNATTTPRDTSSDILFETDRDIKFLQIQVRHENRFIQQVTNISLIYQRFKPTSKRLKSWI